VLDLSEAARHGLAIGFGDTASVGIGGLTLGGGVGYLARKHGLTIDSLLAAELVTDGRTVRTDADTHPELFWAIRGGGGNFGVATRLRFQLHELDGVVGGMLLLPATVETVAGFVAAAEAAPEELSAIANVMPAPPCRPSPSRCTAGWSSWPSSASPATPRPVSAPWPRSEPWPPPWPTWERLVAVKRRWDPTNLFRHNHNIPPGGQAPERVDFR
jgi:FAD/FMN-containing dehydrogenase